MCVLVIWADEEIHLRNLHLERQKPLQNMSQLGNLPLPQGLEINISETTT